MSYQKLLANSQSLADLLDENMPDLPQDKPTPEGKISLKINTVIFFFLVSINHFYLSSLLRCTLLKLGVLKCL